MTSVSLFVGYRIGQLHSTPSNDRTNFVQPRFVQQGSMSEQGSGSLIDTTSAAPVTSDPSWSNKIATSEPDGQEHDTDATVNIHRYYEQSPRSSVATNGGETDPPTQGSASGRAFVASKNGTKYYPVNCKSADRIKEENKVYFATAEEAELEDLTPASTC